MHSGPWKEKARICLWSLGDIIYVSNRPWARAEELLDRAASAFVESAVITWTSIHVGAGVPAGTATLTATP